MKLPDWIVWIFFSIVLYSAVAFSSSNELIQVKDGQLVDKPVSSLSGHHLYVVWPRWEGNPKGLSGPVKGGVILDYLASRFNFTYDYVRVTENWLEPMNNNTRGLFNYLWDQKVDLLMSSVIPSSQRLRVVDISSAMTYDTFVLLIPTEEDHSTNNTNAVIKPFQWPVWLLLLVSMIGTTFIFKIVQYSLIRHVIPSATEPPTGKPSMKRTNPYIYVFGNLLSQGGTFTPSWTSVRLVAGTWTLAAFVFVQAYQSTLITYVLAPSSSPQVDSFRALAESSDYHFLIKNMGTMDILLSQPQLAGIFKKLRKRVDSSPKSRCTLVSECISQVKPGKPNVFADARTYQLDAIKQRYEETGRCELQLGKDSFMNLVSCFALQKNSPYTPAISKGLMELQENGLFNFWDLWFRPMTPKCISSTQGTSNNKKSVEGKHRRLSFKNLTGAFVVLGVGIGISFIVFLIELATWHVKCRAITI